MSDLEVDAEDLRQVGEDLGKMGRAVQAEIPLKMRKATLILEREAKKQAPVNLGALRSSIGSEIEGLGLNTIGRVGSAKSYAPFVELGTRPHWPPLRPIIYWVARKFRATGLRLRRIARGVQRGIAARGTRARLFLQGAFEEKRKEVVAVFTDWIKGLKF